MTGKKDSLSLAHHLPRRQIFVAAAQGLLLLFPLNVLGADVEKPPAKDTGIKKLLADFRKCPGISADFQEEKRIALLRSPLHSSGKVYFHASRSLARIVDKPRPGHLVITGTRIVMKDDTGRKEVDLSDKPALRGLITSLLQVLSGDEKKLLEHYDLVLEGSADATWKLRLVPRDKALKAMVRAFQFAGKGLILSELVVSEASGDETVTRFSNVNIERRFSASEIARIFEI